MVAVFETWHSLVVIAVNLARASSRFAIVHRKFLILYLFAFIC